MSLLILPLKFSRASGSWEVQEQVLLISALCAQQLENQPSMLGDRWGGWDQSVGGGGGR